MHVCVSECCQLKLPNGSRAVRRFKSDASALQLWSYVAQQLGSSSSSSSDARFELLGPGNVTLDMKAIHERSGTFSSESLGGASVTVRPK